MPANFRCPAYQDGACHLEHVLDSAAHCPLFRCVSCRRKVPWCFGGSEDEQCNDCWASAQERLAELDARAYVS